LTELKMRRHTGYQPKDVFEALDESEMPVSALFTTYTFSPGTFRQEYLIPLLHRGCDEISVLTDPIGYGQSIFSAATVQSIGTDYRLRQVQSDGSFHGKLVVIRTRHAAYVGVGSGNLTAPGLQTNAEVGSLYRVDKNDQLELLEVLVKRLRSLALIEEKAKQPVPPIQLMDDARLITSLDSPIFDQLGFPADVSRIELISPFVDGQQEAVARISSRWPKARIRLRLDPDFGALSESLLDLASERVSIQVPSEPQTEEGRPPVHGKLFCFIGKNAATIVLGSANLSRPGLLTKENFEAVVERRMKADEVESLLSVPETRWRKASIDDRKPVTAFAGPKMLGVVIASLHFRRLKASWSSSLGEGGTAKIWFRGRLIHEIQFAGVAKSEDRSTVEMDLAAKVFEKLTGPCLLEIELDNGRLLLGWIEVTDMLGMGQEAKRQLVFLDAITADPLSCNEKEVVKFIEHLQRRLEAASRNAAYFAGSYGKSQTKKEEYDTTPISRRDLLELGGGSFSQFFALERLLNRSLDSALHDLRFFSRDRDDQPLATTEADRGDGKEKLRNPTRKVQGRLPLKIETVLTALFDQLKEKIDAADSPAAVATFVSQIPTCIKALAFAAEKWKLLPEQRREWLIRFFHKVAIACLAPGIACVARRSGAVRRLEETERGKLTGGTEFGLGVATLEAYLLLDHERQPLRDGSFNKDMYDVLRELRLPDSTTLAAAAVDVQSLMGEAGDTRPNFESLRLSMAAVTGEFAALRGRRAALNDLINRLHDGVRETAELRPIAEAAVGLDEAESLLRLLVEHARRIRVVEVSSDQDACSVCFTVFPQVVQSRLNRASAVAQCNCGVFLVRSLDT
jgi:hypothetical protein